VTKIITKKSHTLYVRASKKFSRTRYELDTHKNFLTAYGRNLAIPLPSENGNNPDETKTETKQNKK